MDGSWVHQLSTVYHSQWCLDVWWDYELHVFTHSCTCLFQFCVITQITVSIYFSLFSRRLYVGDPNVWYQAFPGRKEQWRDWQDREWRASGYAPSVPSYSLQLDDKVLVIRSQQEATIHRTENSTEVLDHEYITRLRLWVKESFSALLNVKWRYLISVDNLCVQSSTAFHGSSV